MRACAVKKSQSAKKISASGSRGPGGRCSFRCSGGGHVGGEAPHHDGSREVVGCVQEARAIQLTRCELLEPLGLNWKARRLAELALMDDLVPLLKERAAGREISGLSAYES